MIFTAKEGEKLICDAMSERIIETAGRMVTSEGAHNLTVRKILSALGITNRVFYNRFHNIDEVLEIVYKNTITKVRESISDEYDDGKDFFEYVMDVVASTLIISYDIKMQFNQYVFENDSVKTNNYKWWMEKIIMLIEYAKKNGYIKDVDSEKVGYAIWCFIRGYNADAVGRRIPKEEAVKNFRYSFSFLLEGLKK